MTEATTKLCKLAELGLKLKKEGNSHYKENNLEIAKECYIQAIEIFENNENSTHSEVVDNLIACLLNMSIISTKENNFTEGVKYADKVLQKFPKSTKAYYRRAQANHGQKKFGNCIKDYEYILRIEPKNTEVEKVLTLAKENQKKSENEGILGEICQKEIYSEPVKISSDVNIIPLKGKAHYEKLWQVGKEEFDKEFQDKQKMATSWFELEYEGGKYTGQLKGEEDIRHGFGVITYTDGTGSVYMGGFEDDKFDGYGEYRYRGGSGFKGQFKNDEKIYGKETYPDGTIYIGGFQNLKKNGHGFCTYIDGSMYEGFFLNGQKSGTGTYIRPGFCEMSGEWQNDKLNGHGVTKTSDGIVYEGDHENGMIQGTGKWQLRDGTIFEGEFVNMTLKDGNAKQTQPDGSFYEGGFRDWKRDGTGDVVYKNGQKFMVVFEGGNFVSQEDYQGYKDGRPVEENGQGYLEGVE